MTDPLPTRSNSWLSLRGAFPLRLKFIIILCALSVLPLIFIVLHLISGYESIVREDLAQISDPLIHGEASRKMGQLQASTSILASILILLILMGTYIAEKFFIGEVRTLLSWIKEARAQKYSGFTEAPLSTSDELGELGREMKDAILYFQEIGEREKKMVQERSEFVSVAAHALRTPLTGLRWGIEHLLSKDTPIEKRTEIGRELNETVERLISLTDDLLDVAKLEEGKFGYTFVMTDIAPLLDRLIEHFTLVARSHHISLSLESPPVVQTYCDPVRLEVAFSNLISNAVNYNRDGGAVRVALRDMGSKVEFSVSDTGIGIPESHMQNLFGKFSRAENAMRMRPDGSGLGLFITRNIVERHGSALNVKSKVGEGTTFSFTIPKSEEDFGPKAMSVEDFFEKV